MDPATGQIKRYELDAKKESKENGNAEENDDKPKTSSAVAAALAAQQNHVQTDYGSRGSGDASAPFNIIISDWAEFTEWK